MNKEEDKIRAVVRDEIAKLAREVYLTSDMYYRTIRGVRGTVKNVSDK